MNGCGNASWREIWTVQSIPNPGQTTGQKNWTEPRKPFWLPPPSQAEVREFFRSENPEYVFLAAAKVGGIQANDTYPADFIVDNLAIELNVISVAHAGGVKRLLFLGSSCRWYLENIESLRS
ncbi:MAG: NAD-dependent epimerase/dehydratase family protein [Gammaproteobacteria bacterium]|nr:NAD-dependent epimerase/dehydratase family protein [Gammaproteobacteria bacterium]